MIAKEYAASPTSNRIQQAGDDAERQMAHYLRRAFSDQPGVQVFNNLRLEHDGEVAQIDHLVFHRAGFVIVESKSVTSSVRINERDEWTRQWNGQWRGMPSPVLQVRRQGDLLRALLQAHREELRNRIMFGLRQGGFRGFIIDVVVAISDQGVIQHRGKLPDVRKADQVPEYLAGLMAGHLRAASLLSSETRKDDLGFNLVPEEVTRISAFLRSRHRERVPESSRPQERPAGRSPAAEVRAEEVGAAAPATRPVVAAATPVPATPTEAPRCGKCRSAEVEVKFGHSYYLHCRSCDANTPIRLTCPRCAAPTRTRKSGKRFFRDCAPCGTSDLYHTNPA